MHTLIPTKLTHAITLGDVSIRASDERVTNVAKKITEILIDDLDGVELPGTSGETVRFALDGVNYEIDLSTDNARALREALQLYIAKGRRTAAGSAAAPRRAQTGKNDPRELGAAREWLRAKGHSVSDRGRIPAVLLAEFRAAQ